MIHVSELRLKGLLRPFLKYLAVIALSVAIGFALGWFVWPVKWQGALPADLHDAYKILIVNSVAEDQQIVGSDSLTPGAAKILGYIASDPKIAVNEALGLLRADGQSGLILDDGEGALIEANLLALQGVLIGGLQTPDGNSLPVTESTPAADLVRDNRVIQLFSVLSSIVLVAGLLFVAWRAIARETELVPDSEPVASLHSDLDLGESGGDRPSLWSKMPGIVTRAKTRLRDFGMTRLGTEDTTSQDEADELEDPEYQEYRLPRSRR